MRLPHKVEYEVSRRDANGNIHTVQVGLVSDGTSAARGVFCACAPRGIVKLAYRDWDNIALDHLRNQHGAVYDV